jgi:hypothetical protein
MLVVRSCVVAAVMVTTGWTFSHSAERVDLLLVLAADVSRSMDETKFRLQRSGYAAAFSNPRVIEAIRGGPSGRIAVAFVEWSGPLSQTVVIDWTVIGNDKTARRFGDRVVEAPRAFADSTSISAGIDFAMTQLDRAPYQAHRRVIDVSGDDYRTNVIGGDGAFVVVAENFNSFGDAIIKKLIVEIAQAEPRSKVRPPGEGPLER